MNFRNKIFVRTIQVLFGFYLVFLGVIGYLIELPSPPYNEAGLAFLGAFFNTGYMFHLMSIIFLFCGLMFIINRWSAFAAILLAPITANILLFHVFLDFTGFWLALIPILLNIYLLAVHWPKYKPIFSR